MATVCVGCGLNVDDEGKLVVEVSPGTLTERNSLECQPDGLIVRQKRKHLRRRFTAAGSLAADSDVGPAVGRAMDQYVTVENSGGVGTDAYWTINGDGSVTVAAEGVYLVSHQTILQGSTGVVVGGRARVFTGDGSLANIICSNEFNDRNHVVSLAYDLDGPEFSATAVRHLAAGAVLKYVSNAYLAAVGQGINWAGEFTLTYLGEFA